MAPRRGRNPEHLHGHVTIQCTCCGGWQDMAPDPTCRCRDPEERRIDERLCTSCGGEQHMTGQAGSRGAPDTSFTFACPHTGKYALRQATSCKALKWTIEGKTYQVRGQSEPPWSNDGVSPIIRCLANSLLLTARFKSHSPTVRRCDSLLT